MENMLERNIERDYGFNDGASIAGALVGLVIGIIISVGVALPITQDVVDSGNFSGVTLTVVSYIPVFVALVPMMLVIAFF